MKTQKDKYYLTARDYALSYAILITAQSELLESHTNIDKSQLIPDASVKRMENGVLDALGKLTGLINTLDKYQKKLVKKLKDNVVLKEDLLERILPNRSPVFIFAGVYEIPEREYDRYTETIDKIIQQTVILKNNNVPKGRRSTELFRIVSLFENCIAIYDRWRHPRFGCRVFLRHKEEKDDKKQ